MIKLNCATNTDINDKANDHSNLYDNQLKDEDDLKHKQFFHIRIHTTETELSKKRKK